ncbi:alpha/beta fold hydrolase [Streptomyces sp. NPDC000878]
MQRDQADQRNPSRRAVVGGAALAGLTSLTALNTGNATAASRSGAGASADAPWTPVPLPQQVAVTEYQIPVAGGGSLWAWDTGGDGQPVILLHPGSGSGESWPYQQPVFSGAGFRVIGYSRRGAYGSVAGTRTESDTASGDLNTLADHLGLDRFHLSGSAAGGYVAVDYALSYGDRLYGLTVSSSKMGVTDAEYAELEQLLLPDPWDDMPVDFKELGPSYRGGDRDGVAAWLEINARARTADAFPQSLAHTTTWALLETLTMPVQLLVGDGDLYSPPSLMRLNAQHIQDVEFHVIRESGHNPHWEQSVQWNRLMVNFLRWSGRSR